MSYTPVIGDKIRFTHSHKTLVYRVDQVVLTDEGQILGVVVSIQLGAKRHYHLYDPVTFDVLKPVKVTHGGQVEPASEIDSK